MKSILFDFNGVIVDDEPVHFKLFQKVLAEEGIVLSYQDYYEKYLGMDDFDCLRAASRDQGSPLSEAQVQELTQRKSGYYDQVMDNSPPFVPGAKDFILQAAEDFVLGVVSGALIKEIEDLLGRLEVRQCFSVVLGAEDVDHGKPNPEGYLKALSFLQKNHPQIIAQECLVIEDSPWGLEAAKAAGMFSAAVTTSFKPEELKGALAHIRDFKNLKPKTWLSSLKKT